ncbi:HAD-IA family hydrolase [Streptomyces sp. NPDC005648]|uniref:HAD family hydrolase n=1 Tax=Streptomyces sp. NPDC005648 TaxID=3157044 RepID=UPI00339E46B8
MNLRRPAALVAQDLDERLGRDHRGGLLTDTIEEQAAVRELLDSAQAVLFDFDGPVCDLFGDESTSPVAKKIRRMAKGVWRELDPQVEFCDDSHGVLRCLRDMYDRRPHGELDPSPLAEAERIVAEFECEVVLEARTAPHFVTLVRLLLELPRRLAIVSNNAERPIRMYLRKLDLEGEFEVFGRDPENAGHMKPDPHCVERALDHLGIEPSHCLLVGDQITDLKAAQSVGTPFLGYTQDEVRRVEMRKYGAHSVVLSHLPVVAAARGLITISRGSGPAAP